MIADFGVHAIGEVDHACALRKVMEVAFGGEDIHLIGKQVAFDGLQKLLRVIELLLPLNQLA